MSQWRVQQWRAFAKRWYIFDAYMQCPMLAGEELAKYLLGKNIRYYEQNVDIGSHVVVCNTRHIAAKDNSLYWKRFMYPSYTRFGVFRKDETMEQIHKRDPTEYVTTFVACQHKTLWSLYDNRSDYTKFLEQVLRREVRVHLPKFDSPRYWLARLHLYADGVETIPKDIISNLSGVIPRVMPIPKRLDQYSEEELNEFPKLFDWPKDYFNAPLGYLAKTEKQE